MSHTLTENVTTAANALEDVREALSESGMDMTNVPASDYGDAVRSKGDGLVAPDTDSLKPVTIGCDSSGVYISDTMADKAKVLFGRDSTGIYTKGEDDQ